MASELRRHHRSLDDWVDPLDAYRLLGARDPLLLDAAGAHPEARRSILALDPRLEARLHGGALTVNHDNGRQEVLQGDAFALVRDLTEAWRFPVAEDGFTGGFVGYFGYEATRSIEPTLPAPKGDPGTPDAVLRLCRDAVVFDHVARTVIVWTADLPGEQGAETRLEDIITSLGQDPGPAPEPPRIQTDWETSLDRPGFEEAVQALREHVRTGDLFQANLATRFSTPLDADPVALLSVMREGNPGPYMALLDWGDHVVVSNSPEQLFAVEDGTIRARPIAGTRGRGRDAQEDAAREKDLTTDDKERAEHTMLVDLVRNDIAKVSRPGSVWVPERMSVERYSHVMHLVSRVEGEIRDDTGFTDWLAALFPGGTITGAPKHRACQRIHETEPVPRGPYTGSAGYLSWSHNAHWNILIRTLVLRDGRASVHAGSGIVMDSDPGREWKEAGRKAEALLAAAMGSVQGATDRLGEVSRHGRWEPPAPSHEVEGARVLLIDNYDSFVWNLADYCAALGAQVQVIRNDEDWLGAFTAMEATHVILSPGPGWPEDAGCSKEAAKALAGKVPLLGVCLGHQAIAEASGAKIVVHSEAVHGKTAAIHHGGEGLFQDLPSPIVATRYHSLVVKEGGLGPAWRVDARLVDGTIMAIRHRDHPTFGLQFHPESLCTDAGLEILLRFLERRGD